MSKRKIIQIDETKCTGCGLCLPNCPEGALQIIDGKARLVSDLFCDGLGACIGYCPEGAIEIVEREAEPYDERKVMAVIMPQGANTIRAHLEHLRNHGENSLLFQAIAYLLERGATVPEGFALEPAPVAGKSNGAGGGCPSAASVHTSLKNYAAVSASNQTGTPGSAPAASGLANWPVQLRLLSPMAPQLKGGELLLCADCVAYAVGDFHERYLKGKFLAIACPKLDTERELYVEKLTTIINHANISAMTVLIMQVPCCRGLLAIVDEARARASHSVPIKAVTIAIDDGRVLSEEWIRREEDIEPRIQADSHR